MQKGVVSILCLSMNHAAYVKEGCISIINQTYRDIELLYVDNNSVDDTFEIADELFKTSGLQYRGYKRTENFGISANLNFLLNQAKGEYIAILSLDDWWEKDNLHIKVDYLRANEQFALTYSNGYKYLEASQNRVLFYQHTQKSGWLFKDLLQGNLFQVVSIVYRHNAILKVGSFDENSRIEDWDMYLRIAEKYQIGYVADACCYYRITGNNISADTKFMDKGFEYYFKKYAHHPEIKIAKKNVRMAQAYYLANDLPGVKSLLKIVCHMQWNRNYLKQIVRCLAGILGVKISKK